jgi:GT2 family glycosyltransferase
MTFLMRVSAVILSFNSVSFLDRAIRSLAQDLATSSEQDEIWVVDNGSTDGSSELLHELVREFGGLVNAIYLDHNRGTTVPRNMALRRATGRFLLFMDSDVEVPHGTVDRLIEVCTSRPTCGIVAPQLRYPSGEIQLSTDRFPTVGRKLSRLLALRSMERNVAEKDHPDTVDYAISAFWLLRRDVLERVGDLDERIFYSPEDVDYCLRVWRAGYQVRLETTVSVIHHAQELSRGFRSPRFTLRHARGLIYLFRKHQYCMSRRRLYRRIGRFEGHLP